MNSLWNNPLIETVPYGLITFCLIPLFYFIVWNPKFSKKTWIYATILLGTVYIGFIACLNIQALHNGALSLRSPASNALNAFASAYVMCEHIKLWVWPFNNDFLLRPIDAQLLAETNLLYWLILVLILRHLFRLRKKNPYAWYGMLWALVTLIPISGLWPFHGLPFSQKYLIFPGIGFAITVASLLKLTGHAWTQRFKHIHRKVFMLTLNLTIMAWCLGCTFYFLINARTMSHLETRLTAIMEHDKSNFAAIAELARIKARNGALKEAEQLIIKVGEVAPWYAETKIIKAEILFVQGHRKEAMFYINALVETDPENQRLIGLREHVAKTP